MRLCTGRRKALFYCCQNDRMKGGERLSSFSSFASFSIACQIRRKALDQHRHSQSCSGREGPTAWIFDTKGLVSRRERLYTINALPQHPGLWGERLSTAFGLAACTPRHTCATRLFSLYGLEPPWREELEAAGARAPRVHHNGPFGPELRGSPSHCGCQARASAWITQCSLALLGASATACVCVGSRRKARRPSLRHWTHAAHELRLWRKAHRQTRRAWRKAHGQTLAAV